jgi:hypothetical protein
LLIFGNVLPFSRGGAAEYHFFEECTMNVSLSKRVLSIGLVAVSTALLTGTALGGDPYHIYGTTSAPVPIYRNSIPESSFLKVHAFKAYTNAYYATGGVALRNRDRGVIHISGVTGATQDAYLYWTYLFTTTPTATQKITIDRIYPTGGTQQATLNGKLIGTSGDPCWGSSGGAVYRATVPTSIATGNGLYEVTLNSAAVGLTTGEDPWDGNVVYPLAEGASLVVVGTGSSNVSLFDAPLAGNEFFGTFNYALALPTPTNGGTVLFDSFGADGQVGGSRTANTSSNELADEEVTINKVHISGIGGADPDSDWNGNAGAPIPQLWDDNGHDITAAAPAGTSQLAVTISNPTAAKAGAVEDCLITVGNVVGN